MKFSSPDDISLVHSVAVRLLETADTFLRLRGVQIQIPLSLKMDYHRFNEVRKRHNVQDFRHSEAEMLSVKSIAQWTVDTYRELRNQPRTVVPWKEDFGL